MLRHVRTLLPQRRRRRVAPRVRHPPTTYDCCALEALEQQRLERREHRRGHEEVYAQRGSQVPQLEIHDEHDSEVQWVNTIR